MDCGPQGAVRTREILNESLQNSLARQRQDYQSTLSSLIHPNRHLIAHNRKLHVEWLVGGCPIERGFAEQCMCRAGVSFPW